MGVGGGRCGRPRAAYALIAHSEFRVHPSEENSQELLAALEDDADGAESSGCERDAEASRASHAAQHLI